MPLASSKSASGREVDNRDDPAPEAPDHPRRAAIASMVKQAPAIIRAEYFADAARVMRTALDLGRGSSRRS